MRPVDRQPTLLDGDATVTTSGADMAFLKLRARPGANCRVQCGRCRCLYGRSSARLNGTRLMVSAGRKAILLRREQQAVTSPRNLLIVSTNRN